MRCRLLSWGALLLLLLECHGPCFGATANEILTRAASSCGESVIRSADIQFQAEIQGPAPSPEKVQAAIDRTADALKNQADKHASDPEVRKIYEDALQANSDIVRKQMAANARRKIIGVYRRFGPTFGGDQFAEVRVKRDGEKDWSPVIALLSRRLDPKTRKTVSFDSQARHSMIHSGAASVGVEDPSTLGRLTEPLVSLANLLTDESSIECEIDSEFVASGGQVCVKLTGEFQGNPVYARVVVDPTKGYICPLIEYGFAGGRVDVRIESRDYFLADGAELWFPASCTTTVPVPGGLAVTEYSFEQATVRLNSPLPADAFELTLPAGTAISYQLAGHSQELKAKCDIHVTIDEVEKLLDHKCLKEGLEGNDVSLGSPGRSFFLYFNIIVVLVLLAVWVQVRIKKRGQV